jgi:hypothetical protein
MKFNDLYKQYFGEAKDNYEKAAKAKEERAKNSEKAKNMSDEELIKYGIKLNKESTKRINDPDDDSEKDPMHVYVHGEITKRRRSDKKFREMWKARNKEMTEETEAERLKAKVKTINKEMKNAKETDKYECPYCGHKGHNVMSDYGGGKLDTRCRSCKKAYKIRKRK